MNVNEILKHVDHTLLLQGATWEEIQQICDDGIKYQTASVCIPPCYVKQASEYVQGKVAICTVIGFPNGNMTTKTKEFETKDAIENGADEIDMVINIGWLKDRKYQDVEQEIRTLKEACGDRILKVIIETGELKDLESIFNASLIAAYAGADFIKTSTGKVPVNATPESVYVMCEAIRQYYAQTGKRIGLKVAGGVSKAQNAIRYLTIVNHVLGCEWLTPYYFRIGASQLMDDIVKEIKALQMIK